MRQPMRSMTAIGRSAGFTLIEIMVGLMIIAIIITLATLNLGLLGDDRRIEDQVRKLSTIIELTSEEAQMQGRDFGLEFLYSGYRFLEFDPILEVWTEIGDDDLLAARQLDEGLEFELILEDRRIQLLAEAKETEQDEDSNERDLTNDYLPHVLIMSSGDISPFELEVVRLSDQTSIRLTANLAGVLEIVRDDQP
jgi:general secretion pathway protein H